jgi:hypothetical protein
MAEMDGAIAHEQKPFPWNCSNCRKQAVYGAVVDYATTMHHDGHEYSVQVKGLTPNAPIVVR